MLALKISTVVLPPLMASRISAVVIRSIITGAGRGGAADTLNAKLRSAALIASNEPFLLESRTSYLSMGARFAGHPDYDNALMASSPRFFETEPSPPAQRRITDITAVLKINGVRIHRFNSRHLLCRVWVGISPVDCLAGRGQ